MHKLIPYIAFIAMAITLGFFIKSNLEIKKDYKELQQTIANTNKADEQAVKTITKIQEKIKYVKEDCYHIDINSDIIDRVRGK